MRRVTRGELGRAYCAFREDLIEIALVKDTLTEYLQMHNSARLRSYSTLLSNFVCWLCTVD